MDEVLSVESNEDGSQDVTMRLPAPPQTYPLTKDYEHDDSEFARFSRLVADYLRSTIAELDDAIAQMTANRLGLAARLAAIEARPGMATDRP